VKWGPAGPIFFAHTTPADPEDVVSLARIVLGALLAGIVARAFDVDNTLPWYAPLVALRAVEWAAIVWLFYERMASNSTGVIAPKARLDDGLLDVALLGPRWVLPKWRYLYLSL
jgi:hypothetical protein